MPALVLAIAGCSGSGKTTLAEELARELEGTHFQLDDYYRDLSGTPAEERARQNFDHPDQLEHELLIAHVRELKAGRAIERPCYDFATHTRVAGKTARIEEHHVLILDGIFALQYPDLRALADLCIYVDAPDEICYARRLARDVHKRGRTPEAVAEHYAATVRPMAELYVRPSASHADLVVDGNASLDWAVEQALGTLRMRKLLPSIVELPLGLS